MASVKIPEGKHYTVISTTSLPKLIEAVNEAISLGWNVKGSIEVLTRSKIKESIYYYQALTRGV